MLPLCLRVPTICCTNPVQLLLEQRRSSSLPLLQLTGGSGPVTPGRLGHSHQGCGDLPSSHCSPPPPPLSQPVINLTKMTADRCQPLQRSNEIYGFRAVHQGAEQSTPDTGTSSHLLCINKPRISLAAITVISPQATRVLKQILTNFNVLASLQSCLLVCFYSKIAHSELFWVRVLHVLGVRLGGACACSHTNKQLRSAQEWGLIWVQYTWPLQVQYLECCQQRGKKKITPWHKYAVCALVSCNFFTSMCRNIYPQQKCLTNLVNVKPYGVHCKDFIRPF